MLSKKPAAHISVALGHGKSDAPHWWQRSSIVRKLSLALFLFAVQAALLSSCLPSSLLTFAADPAVANVARDATGAAAFPDLYEASIAELQGGLEEGLFTSEDLVKVGRAPLLG